MTSSALGERGWLSPPAPDPLFAEPRLARIYDALEADRADLDAYEALVAELGARSVLDVGCGTGTFACRLAAAGLDVVGVDPAAASLDVARAKPRADDVHWVLGDATVVPPLQVDLVTMTGNVAMVFTGDDDWSATLDAVRARLRPGGCFVVRDARAGATGVAGVDARRRRSSGSTCLASAPSPTGSR